MVAMAVMAVALKVRVDLTRPNSVLVIAPPPPIKQKPATWTLQGEKMRKS